MSGNYGHDMNTEITDDGNDDDPGTPGKELTTENADNTTGASHSTHSHYIPLPGTKSKVWKYSSHSQRICYYDKQFLHGLLCVSYVIG